MIYFLYSFCCFSQRSNWIGLNYNTWSSRNFGELSYSHRNHSNYGETLSFGFGQLGKRIYDNKTKDVFGLTYSPDGHGFTYYIQGNVGGYAKILFDYQYELNRFVAINPGFLVQLETYKKTVEQDIVVNSYPNYVETAVQKSSAVHYNFAFGFNVLSYFRLSKRTRLLVGVELPFHVLNPNKYNVDALFDPPMLGLEPYLKFGIIYKVKK